MNEFRSHPRPMPFARLVPPPRSPRLVLATVWPWLFWLCWGAWLAVSDLRASELQPSVMRVLMGAVVLGYARPMRWWTWALALAAWVPAGPVIASILGVASETAPTPGMFVLPLFPAFVGAFLGRSMAVGVMPRRSATSSPESTGGMPEDRAA